MKMISPGEYNSKGLPELLHEAKDEIIRKYNLAHLGDRLTKTLDYNLVHGELIALKIVMPIYKDLMGSRPLNGEKLKAIYVLGWCIELFFISFNVLDDIMDNSTSRFGRPCWYALPEVGMSALNDAVFLENMIFYLLRKHFDHHECYLQLVETFHEVMLVTSCGQNLDSLSCQKSVESFNLEVYKRITDAKAGYSAFYLPLTACMYIAGIKNPLAFEQLKPISIQIGYVLQAQNDFLDCYGNPKNTGKIGTDIEENKCSWLSAKCMEIASDEQKAIMKECYGKADAQKVQRVKQLYNDLNMIEVYASFEAESMKEIKSQLLNTCNDVPREGIFQVLNKICKCELF